MKLVDDPHHKRAKIFKFTKMGMKFANDAKEICEQLDKKYEALLGTDAITKIKGSVD